jgi:hypothetical protein
VRSGRTINLVTILFTGPFMCMNVISTDFGYIKSVTQNPLLAESSRIYSGLWFISIQNFTHLTPALHQSPLSNERLNAYRFLVKDVFFTLFIKNWEFARPACQYLLQIIITHNKDLRSL